MPLAAAAFLLAAAAAFYAAGTAPDGGWTGQVTVLNPESHPLVGGIWAVEIEVLEGGDLRVAAVEGTAFGEDVEFAGLYRGGEGLAMPPSSVGEGGALLFEGVAAGTWTLEVTVRTDGPHHLRFEMGGEAAHAGNTAAFADVTSTTPDGRHGPGETVDVRINFTEPVSFEYLGITDGGSDAAGGTFEELEGAFSITTAKIGPYHYALVAADFDDGVQIVNITDPANPTAVANFTAGDTYPVLRDPASITTAQIGPYHYALVAATLDDGVQIVNITNPASPAPVANLTDGDTYPALNGAKSITTAQIGPYHYALVAAAAYSGVQIVNITNPASPAPVANLTDGDTYPELKGAWSITTAKIGPYHYALVAARGDDGVQIVNITNPASPAPVANLTAGDTYPALYGAFSITTAQIGPYHYALVAAYGADGVQIVNITDPASPAPVANLTDGDTYPALYGAASITTAQIGPYHYALVAAADDSGVQIVNITDPASPAPVANLADGPAYPTLYGASSITTAQIGPYHYALVAAYDDHGVQIIDITEPARPFDPLLPYVNLNLEGERRATYKGQGDGGHSLVFEYAVRDGDMTCDLAYDGTDALWLGYNNLTDVDDSADLSGTTLPTPGHPHSLSQNKRIELGAQTDNNPPVVTADSVQPVNEGQNATLSGSATDFDLCDTLRFQWSQASPSDPLAILHSPNSMTTTFTAPRVDADTDFNFTLTVNDGTDDGTDHVIITVRDVPDNFPPMVDAGSSKTVAEGSTVTLAGRATDPDQGDALTYLWSQVSPTSPAIAFADPSSPSTTFTAPQVSSHTAFTLALTATDSANAAGTGQVTITVRDVSGNLPPVASISGSNTIPEGSRGTLAGAGTDPDGSIVSYRWRADNAGVALDNAASPTLAYTAPQVGADTVVRFTLVVTDEDGATGSATHGVTITNTPAPPAPEPAPRSGGGGGGSSSRGGGGGGGGAPAAVITDVRIYSVSWDCAAGTASATAGPDTDQLSVKIRTSSVGERPASPVAATLAETRTFEFPISGADEFAVVQGSLAYEGDQVITKIATLDPCTGTVTFDRYEPPQAAVPEPEPESDLCGDGWEPALRDGSRLLCLFPGTFETLNERGWGLVRP